MDGGGLTLNTYDLEFQHGFSLGSWNNIVWGIGDRIHQYRITDAVSSSATLAWMPNARTLNLADIFAEDHIPLGDRVQLSLGLKLENDPYSGISPMPDGRLSWQVAKDHMLWAAISRAVRSPTPFDTDVVEKLGAVTFLTGNPNFLPEQVTAYEAGYRGQFSSVVSFSVSLFENVYDDLKSIEPTIPTILPLYWGNGLEGDIYGLEAWGSYQALDWWRLSAGFNIQHENLEVRARRQRPSGRRPGRRRSAPSGVAALLDEPDGRPYLRRRSARCRRPAGSQSAGICRIESAAGLAGFRHAGPVAVGIQPAPCPPS